MPYILEFIYKMKSYFILKLLQTIHCLYLYYLISIRAELTADFREFLDQEYGSEFGEQMSRTDMGPSIFGSFGGKADQADIIVKQPVIFIHGVTLRAGVFRTHRVYFINKGYSAAELYATTYSDGGITPFYQNDLKCENVRQIRNFILAVHEYTNKTVDIIAYSMGVAISRKAILGGNCVDTGEFLGPSITDIIDTFVSVGGVAYGMEWCPKKLPACNEVNGMVCTSAYMQDVNKPRRRYEGKNSFGIYSSDDHIVGQHCCDHPCSELNNANANTVVRSHDHVTLLIRTMPMQCSLVQNHTLPDS